MAEPVQKVGAAPLTLSFRPRLAPGMHPDKDQCCTCFRNNHGRKRTLLDWVGLVLPFTVWIRTYKVKQWLLVSARRPEPS